MRLFTWGLALLMGIVFSAAVAESAGAAEGAAGQKLFVKYRCQSCHSLKAQKLEKTKAAAEDEEVATAPADGAKKKEPPDLSGVGLTRKAEWVEGWLLKKEMIEGKKHRKKFRGTPGEAKTMAVWLATMKTKVDGAK